jgi:hypothetical protein
VPPLARTVRYSRRSLTLGHSPDAAGARAATTNREEDAVHNGSDPEQMATADLVRELAAGSSLLIKRQIKLAQIEGKHELKERLGIFELFGVSGVLAYSGVLMLLVAAGLAIGAALGSSLVTGALIVAAALLLPAVVTGLVSYLKLKKAGKPLSHTRAGLDKEIAWTKTLTTS